MSEKLTTEKQNEILVSCLLAAANYDFSRENEPDQEPTENPCENPAACLKMVNQKFNQELSL